MGAQILESLFAHYFVSFLTYVENYIMDIFTVFINIRHGRDKYDLLKKFNEDKNPKTKMNSMILLIISVGLRKISKLGVSVLIVC